MMVSQPDRQMGPFVGVKWAWDTGFQADMGPVVRVKGP